MERGLKKEIGGLGLALLSSTIGGSAIVATRALATTADPVLLGALRFGIGALVLWPIAVARGERWPRRKDLPAVLGLGLLFFAAFPVLFNSALALTTAARGALTLSTLPLVTIALGAILGLERPTVRKVIGAIIAFASMVGMLRLGLTNAPSGAWRGDLLMIAAAICMALYTCWSRPIIVRSDPLRFVTLAMAAGATALLAAAILRLGFIDPIRFICGNLASTMYLGVVCGALVFWLWSAASARAAPSTVALSVLANPVIAMILGALMLGEPLSSSLIMGTLFVALGIAVAVRPVIHTPSHR